MAIRLTIPILSEVRLRRPAQPSTDLWRELPVARRQQTRLGVSFRPQQVDALGLEARTTLDQILAYPFQPCAQSGVKDRPY